MPSPDFRKATQSNIGVFPVGEKNQITDVGGVRVGHASLIRDENIRTGVTIVAPHPRNIVQEKVHCGLEVANGYGKLVGSTQIQELGVLETYIGLTNTLSTFQVAESLIRYHLAQPENKAVFSLNPLVGETNDGYLNDIRQLAVKDADVQAAIADLSGEVVQGNIGAGVGIRAFGYKGGIGTSSRIIPATISHLDTTYALGVLTQANFGGFLHVLGKPVWQQIGRNRFEDELKHYQNGSCVIIIATDAPFSERQLRRLAKRALTGLIVTGSFYAHGSGDYAIAFSTTAHQTSQTISEEKIDPFFKAAQEAVEESVYNALFLADTMSGYQGRILERLPWEKII